MKNARVMLDEIKDIEEGYELLKDTGYHFLKPLLQNDKNKPKIYSITSYQEFRSFKGSIDAIVDMSPIWYGSYACIPHIAETLENVAEEYRDEPDHEGFEHLCFTLYTQKLLRYLMGYGEERNEFPVGMYVSLAETEEQVKSARRRHRQRSEACISEKLRQEREREDYENRRAELEAKGAEF